MCAYPGYPPGFAEFVTWARGCFEALHDGRRVVTERFGEPQDLAAFRRKFGDASDGRINNRGMLRSDGAPAKDGACNCMACAGKCSCSACYNSAEYRNHRRGGATWSELHPNPARLRRLKCCHRPWGGRKWEDDYQTNLSRDAWALRDWYERRIRPRFLTREVRVRLQHLDLEREGAPVVELPRDAMKARRAHRRAARRIKVAMRRAQVHLHRTIEAAPPVEALA